MKRTTSAKKPSVKRSTKKASVVKPRIMSIDEISDKLKNMSNDMSVKHEIIIEYSRDVNMYDVHHTSLAGSGYGKTLQSAFTDMLNTIMLSYKQYLVIGNDGSVVIEYRYCHKESEHSAEKMCFPLEKINDLKNKIAALGKGK